MGYRSKKGENYFGTVIMSEEVEITSGFDIKIYIDPDGNVTITSLLKDLLPLVQKLSCPSGNREAGNENCS